MGSVRVGLVVLTVALAGCSSSTGLSGGTKTTEQCQVAIGTAGATVCPGTGEPLTTGVSTTTTVEVQSSPAELPSLGPSSVSDCVAYVPTGAFMGDAKASDLWNFIGQDTSRLQELCNGLAQTDPGTLIDLSSSYAAYEALSSTTTVATASTPPTTPG